MGKAETRGCRTGLRRLNQVLAVLRQYTVEAADAELEQQFLNRAVIGLGRNQ